MQAVDNIRFGKQFYQKFDELISIIFDENPNPKENIIATIYFLLANKIFSGTQIRMAKALGVSRGSLQYKMKQLEL